VGPRPKERDEKNRRDLLSERKKKGKGLAEVFKKGGGSQSRKGASTARKEQDIFLTNTNRKGPELPFSARKKGVGMGELSTAGKGDFGGGERGRDQKKRCHFRRGKRRGGDDSTDRTETKRDLGKKGEVPRDRERRRH